jgi:hypothetical protein
MFSATVPIEGVVAKFAPSDGKQRWMPHKEIYSLNAAAAAASVNHRLDDTPCSEALF